MTMCAAPGCDRDALARGLCRKHYSRERRGKPLADERPVVGSPDGHGLYGVLDDDGMTVLCHECGQRFVSLGSHVAIGHGIRADDYRRAHGLPRGRGLVSRSLAAGMSAHSAAQVGTDGWRRMEARRDPAAASAARTEDAWTAAASRLGWATRARAQSRRNRGQVVACTNCGVEWCPLPDTPVRRTCSDECAAARLMHSAGVQKHPSRDAAIAAAVAAGEDPTITGARFGVGRDRALQIYRAESRTE